jgi:hypothetical protein
VKGQPHALKSGDWIFIEPYEIRASITGPVKEAASTISDLFPASPDNPSRRQVRLREIRSSRRSIVSGADTRRRTGSDEEARFRTGAIATQFAQAG